MHDFKKDELDATDFEFIFLVGKEGFGFKTTSISGGEPLLRNDIEDIASKIAKESERTSITTNGFLLEERLGVGAYIQKVNVSLHSLNKEIYEKIVNIPGTFERVINGLYKFREKYSNVGISFNATLVESNSSINDIKNLINLSKELKASINFSELYPPDSEGVIPIGAIEEQLLNSSFNLIKTLPRTRSFSNGTTIIGLSKIFCVMALESNSPAEYCREYRDVFVSPDGKIKVCRNDTYEIDILNEVKNRDKDGLKGKIQESLDLLGSFCRKKNS